MSQLMIPSMSAISAGMRNHLPRAGAGVIQIYAVFMTWAHTDEDVERVLEDLNRLLEGSGVYAVEQNTRDDYWHHTGLLYVDLGDPYEGTLYFDTKRRRFRVGSWAEAVDRQKRRFGKSASKS